MAFIVSIGKDNMHPIMHCLKDDLLICVPESEHFNVRLWHTN
jgi:hypothetical protein